MFNKKLMAVVVLLAVAFSVPSWGAQFKRKTISDQQFLEMCKEGNTQGVIEAIKSGANVNAKKNDGETALMVAALNGHTVTVKALIQAGADVNAKNNKGETALMFAAKYEYTETVNTLIEAGAEDLTDYYGKTALIHAAEHGRHDRGKRAAAADRGAAPGARVPQKSRHGRRVPPQR